MKPTIAFEMLPDDELASAREVICTIWPVIEAENGVALSDPVIASTAILVGDEDGSTEASTVELPGPGTYLVDIGFPNGRHTRRTISLKSDEHYRFLLQDKRYVAPVVSSSMLRKGVHRVVAAAASRWSRAELEITCIESAPFEKGAASLSDLRAFVGELGDLTRAGEPVLQVSNAEISHSSLLPSSPPFPVLSSTQRSWLVVCGNGKNHTLVAYPRGWSGKHEDSQFLVKVRRRSVTGPESTKWSVSLELRDATYGSLIENLNRRDLCSTEAIARSSRAQAQQALFEKSDNPFAAAAGAYLIALGSLESDDRREWMINLVDRFPWLPDGAIAMGWRLMREGGQGREQWRQAKSLFIEAARRGLPYYTVGLHILVDGLNLLALATPSDTDVRETLALVNAVDLSCVRSEAFTTLQSWRYLGLPTSADQA